MNTNKIHTLAVQFRFEEMFFSAAFVYLLKNKVRSGVAIFQQV